MSKVKSVIRQMFIPSLHLCDCLSGSASCHTGLGLNWIWLRLWVSSSERKPWQTKHSFRSSGCFQLLWRESKVSDREHPGDNVVEGEIIVSRRGIFNWGEHRSSCVFTTRCNSITERNKGLRSKVRLSTISVVIDSKLAFLSLIHHWESWFRAVCFISLTNVDLWPHLYLWSVSCVQVRLWN